MKSLRERTEIQQHYLDGGKVEFKTHDSLGWANLNMATDPSFNWLNLDYRKKKEPRVIWVTHYDNGKIKNVYRSIVCGATKFIEVIE